MSTVTIWFFDKKHKHFHSAMIYMCLVVGLFFAIFGYFSLSISEILALALFLLSGLSFVCAFYYLVDKIKKNRKKTLKNY